MWLFRTKMFMMNDEECAKLEIDRQFDFLLQQIVICLIRYIQSVIFLSKQITQISQIIP